MMALGRFGVTIFQTKEPWIENELLYIHHFIIVLKYVIQSVIKYLCLKNIIKFLKDKLIYNVRYW